MVFVPSPYSDDENTISSEECVFDIFGRVLQISVHKSDVSRIVTCVTVSWKHMKWGQPGARQYIEL